MKSEMTPKCGEIHRISLGLYTFTCAFCGAEFNSSNTIFQHIEKEHFLCIPLPDTTKESNNSTSVEFKTEPPEEREIYDNHEGKDEKMPREMQTLDPLFELTIKEDVQVVSDNISVDAFEVYTCDICKKNIRGSKALTEHLNRHINSSYPCSKCDTVLYSRSGYLRHLKRHRPEKNLDKKSNNRRLPKEDKSIADCLPKTDYLQCDICKKSMKSKSIIKEHMKLHIEQPHPCPECPLILKNKKSLTNHFRRRHPETVAQKEHSCPVCKTVVRTKLELMEHLRLNCRNALQCDQCHRVFTSSGRLERHVHTVHNKIVKKYPCPFCDRILNSSTNRRCHMRIHKEEKEFTCEVCGKMFRGQTNLKVHFRIHTGERPFKCPICDKSFSQSNYIKIHMRGHTGERPYKCDLCDQAFGSSVKMTEHKRKIHLRVERYRCRFCDRGFLDWSRHKEHERMHTGEKPYECGVCSKTFARGSGYRQHILLHGDEKQYKCNYCDKRFTQPGGRYGHEKHVHRKEFDEKRAATVSISGVPMGRPPALSDTMPLSQHAFEYASKTTK